MKIIETGPSREWPASWLGEIKSSMLFRFCSAIERPLERGDAFFELGRELAKKNDAAKAKQAFVEAIKAAEAIEHEAAEIAALLLQVASELKLLGQREELLRQVRRATELVRPKPPVL